MFLGRPTTQWVALITAAASLVQVLVVTLLPEIPAATVAIVLGAVTTFLGVLIAFLAGQPPTVTAGSEVNVVTPGTDPNKTVTVG